MSGRREGSALVAVLEPAWAEIRDVSPRVPEIVVITGAGSGRPRGGLHLGRFAAERWAEGSRYLVSCSSPERDLLAGLRACW